MAVDALDHTPSLPVLFRHSGWQGNRRRIFAAFYRTDQTFNRKHQFRFCGSHAYVMQSNDDPSIYRIAGSTCHDRFCLPCANERSHAIAINVQERITKRTVRFLTLTVRSDKETLTDLLDKLYTSFLALRRHPFWRKRVTGGVAFLEINWSPQRQRWHPHLHVLIEGSFIPQHQLKLLWNAITGDSYIVDIRKVQDADQAARYVTKYASKPFNQTFLARPHKLDEAILALKGRKLVLTFGSWRGVALARKPDPEAWTICGTLTRFIERAAAGNEHCQNVLRSLTNHDLTALYQRAPPLPPTGPDPVLPHKQLTWLAVWQHDGTWRNPDP